MKFHEDGDIIIGERKNIVPISGVNTFCREAILGLIYQGGCDIVIKHNR